MEPPDDRELRQAYYLAKQEEALQRAVDTTDPFTRQAWLNVAENYGFLVEMTRRPKL